MSELVIATTASDNPMGAQRYEREVVEGAPAALPDWRVRPLVSRSLRSPLAGDRRLPISWLEKASPTMRRAVGRFLYPGRSVVHRMDLVLPPSSAHDVVTIHDTVSWEFPDESPPIAAAAEEARRAAAVICVSEFSAREAERLLGIKDPTVVYNGVDGRFFSAPPLTDEQRADLGLEGPYVLHTGGASLRKNLEGLAEAWAKVHSVRPDLTLALCGPPHERRTRLFADLPGTCLLGRQPDGLLPSLVTSATAVVVPSTYEGFGLPALEAMAAGVPVVVADTSALPEVVGADGLVVDCTPDALAQGIEAVVGGGSDVAARAAAGRDRAAEFSWQRCLTEHAAVWQSVAS